MKKRRLGIFLIGVTALWLPLIFFISSAFSVLVTEEWVVNYNGFGNGWEYPSSLVIDDLGNVYVTGESEGDDRIDDYATIKYDSEGNELWVARYNGPDGLVDVATSLAVDDLGNVYVTGYSEVSSRTYDYITIKYDLNGNELWVARYDGPTNGNDEAYSLVVDTSGNVYVTGGSESSETKHDYTTVKYDSEGNELWVARYNGPGNRLDYAKSIELYEDDFGEIYIYVYNGPQKLDRGIRWMLVC